MPVSAHQCRLSVPISAGFQCPSVLPISAHQCCLSFRLISASSSVPISAAYQCPSVQPNIAHQCSLIRAHH
ncbi:unnamed protein product [Staurois parvus]|uniref:Uncharacterized protein n=1 Tax=Staurois parvus TaxID=386267 RepID=A0ABN9FBC6_9NEOB|nr:unnamed protein product [Staurois parvus]